MTQSAVATKHLGSGREQRTDGLWKHLGLIDGGTLRGVNYLPPRSGQGVEIGNIPGAGPTQGVLMSYDRDLDTFRDLTIQARNLLLSASGTLNLAASSLVLPPGSITTSMLAAGAAQQQLGSYYATPSFSTTVTSGWVATPVSFQATTAGGLLRLEASAALYHSVGGAGFYVGWMQDGVINPALAYYNAPGSNWTVNFGMTWYAQPAAGLHTFTLAVYNAAAGTLALQSAAVATLYVTEQKR
jgi:hypothetical protein